MQWILRLGAAGMAFLFTASALPADVGDVSSGRPTGKAVIHAKSPSPGSMLGIRKAAAEAGALPPSFDRPVVFERVDPAKAELLLDAPVVPTGDNRAPPL